MSKLPSGWARVDFDESIEVVSDRGFRIKQKNYLTSGKLPVIDQGEGFIGGYTNDIDAQITSPSPLIVFGDHTRRFKYVTFPFAVGADGVKLFLPTPLWEPKFLFLQLQNINLENRGYGRHFQHLRKESLFLAPLAEQTRIVTKLEELLTDLDAGVAELKTAQKKLAQYRQSLLKAAVEGALTAQWREENPTTENGAQLLERILQERRARWEAKQLAKFAEQGKTPPKEWQKKYPEPVQPDTTNLPPLPEGWVWASVDQLSPDDLANGRSVPSADAGAKVLRLTAVKGSEIDLNEYKVGAWSDDDAKQFAVTEGDLLIVRGNGSLSLVGRAGLVGKVSRQVAYPDTMIRLRVLDAVVNASWVALLWGTQIVRTHLERRARTSAGIYKISQPDIVSVSIPVPPLNEQLHILQLFEDFQKEMEIIQAGLELGHQKTAAQRQNVLRAAFTGQLVPQDPNDEPASVLLERIRAQRAAQAPVKKARGRRGKEAT